MIRGIYHLVGIAGHGMSALAQVLISKGFTVTGSDRYYDEGKDLDIIRKLQKIGVRFFLQNGSGITEKTDAIVLSTSIESDNPDINTAKHLNISLIHRSEMLFNLINNDFCIAVTGTSGKSTVTGMIGWILEQTGRDPFVVNGASVLNWCTDTTDGNVRCGNSDLWVIEADESDKSLLNFYPNMAVITNISKDHFGMEESKSLFKTFSDQVKMGKDGIVYGSSSSEKINFKLSMEGSRFFYEGVDFFIPLVGQHNAENAICAIIICERMGVDLKNISIALSSFKGIHRRMENVGISRGGVTVVDDYAHNPAKIRAVWKALTPYYRRILAIWRPHGFGPLKMMMADLTDVFCELCGDRDNIYILPIYDAGGSADRSINAGILVDKIKERNKPAEYINDIDDLTETISNVAEEGDLVLIMGARDPDISALSRAILSAVG